VITNNFGQLPTEAINGYRHVLPFVCVDPDDDSIRFNYDGPQRLLSSFSGQWLCSSVGCGRTGLRWDLL
jgi:hypothetical protein